MTQIQAANDTNSSGKTNKFKGQMIQIQAGKRYKFNRANVDRENVIVPRLQHHRLPDGASHRRRQGGGPKK